MWKTRTPARTKVFSYECKVQGLSQNRTLPQGMPVQEKDHESQSRPDTRMMMTPTSMKLENMLKTINHIKATRGPQGKHLKFPIATHPKGSYKHHLVVRVDTGADVNCMKRHSMNFFFQWSFCMPPRDTEFQKLNCRHFNAGTILYLLGV